jgi:hypothetical protein
MPKARFAFKPTFGSIKGNVNACDLLVTNASANTRILLFIGTDSHIIFSNTDAILSEKLISY